MTPVSRRTVLGLGALGVATAAVGTAGVLTVTRPWRSTRDTVAGGSLREPPVLRSEDGSLEVTLTAGSGVHDVAGVRARTLGFNGGLPGPTLVVRPGDRLRIRLVNELDEPTNLHVHGLHVSPRDNGDNVFVEVAPGGSFDYEHRLPEDHPPGLYWYHPHHHGMVADQIYGGLYGAILVEDPEPVAVAADRLLVVSDITLDPDGGVLWPSPMEQMMGREGEVVLVNGQARPHVEARSGERQRWRVLNACTSRFLSLRLDGHELHLLVTVGRGDGVLRAVPYDRGGMGMGMGAMMRGRQGGPVRLLDLRVTGAAEQPRGLPVFAAPRDLRDEAVVADRDLVLAMTRR
jgi:FtsP/CotA-like multicopper oxidase with cupredoxin domain